MVHGFDVGDVVVIREWDEMESIYGLNELSGDINTGSIYFDKHMRNLCGSVATIEDIDSDGEVHLKFLDKKDQKESNRWYFTTNMIKHQECVDIDIPTEESLMSFIGAAL